MCIICTSSAIVIPEMTSPYHELPVSAWQDRTTELIAQHPLKPDELKEIVLNVWEDIFESGIGSKPFRIGTDIFPRPQIMAFFLHELIPLELAHRYPNQWRREEKPDDKDLVYIPDATYSVEIKTSSHPTQIFGNRSYTQPGSALKKSKAGYYLAINFEAFGRAKTGGQPKITQLRFGWLDLSDWIGQSAATGQQARLRPDADRYKLVRIPLT
jgi:hypothetical protein